MRVSLIVARAQNGVIGRSNQLPWRLPNDLRYFKQVTMGKPIIMGRLTFDSIGKPLPGRTNIVVTRQRAWSAEGTKSVHSVRDGIELASSLALNDGGEEVIVIGGAQIYREALPISQRIYLTEVHADVEGDAHFPEIEQQEWQEQSKEMHQAEGDNPYNYSFVVLDHVQSSALGHKTFQ